MGLNVKRVSASYTYYAPETMSIEEAKRTALERAKIQAIADEFGTVVSQISSTIVSNNNGVSDTHFLSTAENLVRGEWIETIGEPSFEISFENGFIIVGCNVNGKARAIESSKIDYIIKPLRNGTTLKYESTEFKDGDDLFLFFRSPIDGFLSVYLMDDMEQIVYSILPYKREHTTATQIIAERDYVFFSIKESERDDRGVVDEYTLNSNADKEFNTLFVIFSPTTIGKNSGFLSKTEDTPDNIPYMKFKKWIGKVLANDSNVQISEITITITK